MSNIEVLRFSNPIRDELLEVEARIATAEWAAALALCGLDRGEQPDGQALPADRAMSGDAPRSYTSESEVK